jgi:glycosyltransferase involved in cell wall biosynthesis
VTGQARYVCAFRGMRDSYQAPLALAEGDLLDQLITDAYATPAVRAFARHVPGRSIDQLARRYEAGIPDDRVRCLWPTAIREQLRHAAGLSKNLTWLQYDRHYSEAAASEARRAKANLFLYSPYAWEAFVASYAHQPRRVLFQYHPHPDTERRLLEEDAGRYPAAHNGRELDSRPQIERLIRRERDCWQHADVIICSSAFTKRSLTAVGCPPSRCVVIPYGVAVPDTASPPPADGFTALFVGTGSRRKGLPHLLRGWQRASLPAHSRLVVVSRALDPGIADLAATTRGVELLDGASAAQLQQLYAASSVFVMPSLVEGFGLVYLEAMAHGCPVLGTPNTCLPDLGSEDDGIFVTPAGDIDALVAMLERLARTIPGAPELRTRVRELAARYPWQRFRRAVRDVAGAAA